MPCIFVWPLVKPKLEWISPEPEVKATLHIRNRIAPSSVLWSRTSVPQRLGPSNFQAASLDGPPENAPQKRDRQVVPVTYCHGPIRFTCPHGPALPAIVHCPPVSERLGTF